MIYSNTFRIKQDPSSGSVKLYLTEVTDNGSIVKVVVPPKTDTICNKMG
jgi:hypothetical protein